ncbi:MAG: hypothetical protein PHG16_03960 [Lachnospiraceae bacterium]|nr:hypothetical protein [Lachnospiraceae bacterium]
MRRKRSIIIVAVAICMLLGGLWVVRYHSLNQLIPSPEIKKFGVGETVEMGSISFTLQQVEMLDGNEINKVAPNVDIVRNGNGTAYDPEKIRAIFFHVKIQKKGNDPEDIDLTKVSAESGAWGNGINGQLFMTLNPGVSIDKIVLEENETAEMILPFSMVDTMFRKDDWKKIEEREFSAVLQLYPEKILLTQGKK